MFILQKQRTFCVSVLLVTMISLRACQCFVLKSSSINQFRTATVAFAARRGQITMWGEGPAREFSNRIPNSDASGKSQQRVASDNDGRRIRQRTSAPVENDSFDDWGPPEVRNNQNDDFTYRSNGLKARNSGRGGRGGRGGRSGRGNGRGTGRDAKPIRQGDSNTKNSAADIKINMKALELAGFVHLYGLAPIVNALTVGRRDMTNSVSYVDMDQLDGEDLEHEKRQRERKPEAQFSPFLFIQEGQQKKGDKANMAEEVERLAREREVPVAYVDKGVLNTLSGARPHQGYVLRCGSLQFEHLPRMPRFENDDEYEDVPKLWLVLDEVVDPQNFGALLRSAYFLGGSSSETGARIGVLVCEKNSAPPSPVVSAASAGALEISQIYSTSNLPRLLNGAKEDGWRILGAAASVPNSMRNDDDPVECMNLSDVETGPPTLLVLGSEGSGLRTLVARACTGFVKIPGSEAAQVEGGGNAGVDSLNVSVTGGIMLWHLLNDKK